MKVTALIPDRLVREVRGQSDAKNLTEALVIALREWVSLQKIKGLNKSIVRAPLRFRKHFTAAKIRNLNRSR